LGNRQDDDEQAGRKGGQADEAWRGHHGGLPHRSGNIAPKSGMVSRKLTPHTE
jgi:hypothetical protein